MGVGWGEGKEVVVGIRGLKEGWLGGGGVRGDGKRGCRGSEVGVAREPADSPTP